MVHVSRDYQKNVYKCTDGVPNITFFLINYYDNFINSLITNTDKPRGLKFPILEE